MTSLSSSGEIKPIFLPMRSVLKVLIWLILAHERLDNFAELISSVRGKPAFKPKIQNLLKVQLTSLLYGIPVTASHFYLLTQLSFTEFHPNRNQPILGDVHAGNHS
jgi:hypothetical protein